MAISINEIVDAAHVAFGFTASNGEIYYYGDKAAREAIKAGVNIVSVSSLPTASAETTGKIYLVPTTATNGATSDVKAEYITVVGGTAEAPTYAWEKIGDTSLDLLNYSKVGHKHSVTTNVSVDDIAYTPAGSNADSDVEFAAHTSDNALGEATTFENADSDLKDMSATIAGSNAESDVTFDVATEGHTAQAITGIATSTVPAYELGDATKKHITATASGAEVSTVSKLVVASQDNIGSVTAGSDAELSAGAQASFGTSVDANGIVTFSFTANTLQTLSGGKATVVTLPTFAEQTIATGISAQPTITLADTATEGGVEVVTAQGSLGTNGTNNVTFGELSKAEVLSKDVTAKAAGQAWSQGTTTISGKATAQVITVGTNDKVAALTALGKGTAKAQAFTGTEATLQHTVNNPQVTTGTDFVPAQD